jgi:uncharacterized protein (TIGR00369 family)
VQHDEELPRDAVRKLRVEPEELADPRFVRGRVRGHVGYYGRVPLPPFNQYLGIDVTRMAGGEAEAVVDLKPHHTNNRGVAHGGVVLSLLDSAMGAAVISAIPKEWWCATTGLSVQFVAGPREGRVVGVGRVLKRGKSVAFVHGEAHDASGGSSRPRRGLAPLALPAGDGQARERAVRDPEGKRRAPPRREDPRGRPELRRAQQGDGDRGAHAACAVPEAALGARARRGTVVLPRDLGAIHHEVEMVAVIGKSGRAIPAERALDHIEGFAVGIDLTLRDLQNDAKKKGEPWDLAKGFDGAAPVSLVVPKEHAGRPGIPRADPRGER